GLTASWLLRLAGRRSIVIYLEHQEWATIIATIVVIGTSIGAAIFTYIGMSNPGHLPDTLAGVTSLLALLVPLGITYFTRLFATGRCGAELEVGADLPEFREEALVERRLQVADAGRSASAWLVADLPLHHLDMTQPPEAEAFVMIEQRLGEFEQVRVSVALAIEVAHGNAAAGHQRRKYIVQGGFIQA